MANDRGKSSEVKSHGNEEGRVSRRSRGSNTGPVRGRRSGKTRGKNKPNREGTSGGAKKGKASSGPDSPSDKPNTRNSN
ncbi:hypothetical protein ACFSRY_00280 [Pontibacter locisalis]|uniref:Uncharacterized protein n=1 Tax=Pontibacter locisalis TaxID=1719035 RepID=A0ABW5IGY8_9BACT